jgi:hypothetical protein
MDSTKAPAPDLDALLAEAKLWLTDPCDEGCGECGREATRLMPLLITALEAAREDKADWEQLLKATDAELDDMRDVANECAEDLRDALNSPAKKETP